MGGGSEQPTSNQRELLMGRRRVSGFSPSAYQWCGGSGARRCRFRSTGSQRAAPHGDFGNTSIDRSVRVRPGHLAGRGARPQTAAHQDAASAAPARRTVRRLPSRSARRPRRRVEWAGRARARRPAAVRSPGPSGRCDPWGAIVRGHIAHPSQALAPASRAFRSVLNPTGMRYRQFRIISSSPSASAPGGGAVTVQ